MKTYPRDKIAFPVRPGDTVYFLNTDESVAEVGGETAHSVGVDDDRLFVARNGSFVTFDAEGHCFLTEKYAMAFAENPASLPEDYGTVGYDMLDLPCYPGDELFFPDYDPFFDCWQLLVSTCTHVLFNEDGSVDVYDDTGGEDRIIGERPPLPLRAHVQLGPQGARQHYEAGYGRWKS